MEGILHMNIFIEKLLITDAENLYTFELENRHFFEKMIPSRGDDYYRPEVFNKRHENLLEEQALGGSLFYLIKDKSGSILGRMNLVDIDESQKIGHLGYRVGKSHTGKGIATSALNLLLETVNNKGIKQSKTKTTANNITSTKIIEKNGFEYIESNDEVIEMDGKRLKIVHYSWTN